ncbi:MAG: PilZ domain-containing protein [Gammaproteobacteria bacterium]
MSEDDDKQRSAEERREYFRIDDRVLLNLRPITEAESAAVHERILERVADRFTVAANFAVNSRATARLLHGLSSSSPDAARYMKLLDQKLNQLARLFVLDEVERGDYPLLNVNLSAGGVVFPSRREFAAGDLLELRMVLYPDMVGILTVARVVYCERLAQQPGDFPWQAAVEYEHIRESDRDLLVSHIMARETELLRRQRGED